MRRTTSAHVRSGKHRLHRALLRLADLLDTRGRQVEEIVQLLAGVPLAFRGRLHLDQTAVAAHDDVEVDLGARVLRVVEVEERLAVDDPERDACDRVGQRLPEAEAVERPARRDVGTGDRDRKSTRLNSSHTVISYAVFCLKKKKKHKKRNKHKKNKKKNKKQKKKNNKK